MNTLEMLSKVKALADKWGNKVANGGIPHYDAMDAYSDFKTLQAEIEASLDEMTEGLLKQEQENNK